MLAYTKHTLFVSTEMLSSYQLSGFKPLVNFKKSSNIHYNIWVHFIFIWVNILLYFISFVLFWETENRKIEGNLKVISNQYLSLAVFHYAALSSHYFFYFFANKSFWPKSSINSISPIPNLRQLKFTVMWQYKF